MFNNADDFNSFFFFFFSDTETIFLHSLMHTPIPLGGDSSALVTINPSLQNFLNRRRRT